MQDIAGTITTRVDNGNNYVTEVRPIKAIADGDISRTIYAHYHNCGWTDFYPFEGGNPIPHTGVLEIMKPQCKQVGQLFDNEQNPMNGRVYDVNGVSPTLRTPTGGLSEPKIVSYTRSKDGDIVDNSLKDVANTCHTSVGSGGNTDQYVIEPNVYRIRKLTEREVFRLMDVDDADIDKILNATEVVKTKSGQKEKRAISKGQCYKMAGNSICVGVMFHIFRTLFIDNQPENEYKPKQLELF